MKVYSTYLFDWDECLVQTLRIWLAAYKEVFAEYNIFPSDRDIIDQVFGDWNGPKKMGIKDIDTFTEKFVAIGNKGIATAQLHAHAKEVLEKLKGQGKQLALLTSSKQHSIEPTLSFNHLDNFFSVILTAESVTKHKPDPEIINKAIKKLGAGKESTVMVGDSDKDLEAASRAGIDSVLFYPPANEFFYDLEDLKKYKPTYIIRDLRELTN